MNSDRTFENFVVGEKNRVVISAARSLAIHDRPAFNPLYISGQTGRGKSHLLSAVAAAFREARPGAEVVQMTGEGFVGAWAQALRSGQYLDFCHTIRAADLFLLDDVQFLAGREAACEALFHTMVALLGDGKRVAITADRPPYEMDQMDMQLRSRLSGGLVVDIYAADQETREAILLSKIRLLTAASVVTFPTEVVEFLARRLGPNGHDLESAINRLTAYAISEREPITLDFAWETMVGFLRAYQRRISIDEIQTRVSEHYRIRKAEMTSARRAREVARPRQVAMYLSKQLTPSALAEIGRRFGGRDHTTVIHAIRQIDKLRTTDSELDSAVRELERGLTL